MSKKKAFKRPRRKRAAKKRKPKPKPERKPVRRKKPEPEPKRRRRRRPPRVTYRYRDDRGKFTTREEAVQVEFLHRGERYAIASIEEVEEYLPAQFTRDVFRRERQHLEGYRLIMETDWRPLEETFRFAVFGQLGRLTSKRQITSIVIRVVSPEGIRAIAEVDVTGDWRRKYVRQQVYDLLTFRVLQNVRGAGGNTSADELKTSGTISAAGTGLYLPETYQVTVWGLWSK